MPFRIGVKDWQRRVKRSWKEMWNLSCYRQIWTQYQFYCLLLPSTYSLGTDLKLVGQITENNPHKVEINWTERHNVINAKSESRLYSCLLFFQYCIESHDFLSWSPRWYCLVLLPWLTTMFTWGVIKKYI